MYYVNIDYNYIIFIKKICKEMYNGISGGLDRLWWGYRNGFRKNTEHN